MDPRISPSSQYTTFPQVQASAPPDLPLSEVACRAVMEQVKNTHTQGQAILRFLRSNDPGARMEADMRSALIDRCFINGHSGYLEDVWPGVRGRDLTIPANAPLPALRESHQHEAKEKAQNMDALAQLVIDLSRENLNRLLVPLKADLALTQDKVNALMTDCHPPVCEYAKQFIECIEQRRHSGTLDGCFIAKQVQDLQNKQDMLSPTLVALDALIAVRSEERSPTSQPLAAQSPAFHEEWKRAVKDMEVGDWVAMQRRLATLHTWRAALRPEAP